MGSWAGDVVGYSPDRGICIQDLHIYCTHADANIPFSENATLEYLSLVDVDRIPLCMINGPSLYVWSGSEDTRRYFETILDRNEESSKSAAPVDVSQHLAQSSLTYHNQASIGILVRVQNPPDSKITTTRTTDLLIYFSKSNPNSGHPLTPPPEAEDVLHNTTPAFSVYALPLSSDLLEVAHQHSTSDPLPYAHDSDQEIDAQFLPPYPPATDPSLKRKRSASIFDNATDRRRKTKRHGGESIAAAASRHSLPAALPGARKSLHTTDDASQSQSQSQVLMSGSQTATEIAGNCQPAKRPSLDHRSRSRSRSVCSLPRPSSSSKKTSNLCTVENVQPLDEEASSLEARNKEIISRTVMAGMRLYGLSSSARGATKTSGMEGGAEDEDTYKLVYHQTYKGAVFAFRRAMGKEALGVKVEKVREVVERLLEVFCVDPLGMEEGTDGAGKGGSSSKESGKVGSFEMRNNGIEDGGEGVKRPCVRKGGTMEIQTV
ncbi:MAG: hypothetical protein M1820_010032 [Bogoriella megaspora]|nr:MAG: hypothetical protein M1820_010032 [Bogoriella megaspora]